MSLNNLQIIEAVEEQRDLISRLCKLFNRRRVYLLGGHPAIDNVKYEFGKDDLVVQCNHHMLRRGHKRCEVLFASQRSPITINHLERYKGLKLLCAPIQSDKAEEFLRYAQINDILFLPYVTRPTHGNRLGDIVRWSQTLANETRTIPVCGIIALVFLLAEPWRDLVASGGSTGALSGCGCGLELQPKDPSIKEIIVDGFDFYRSKGSPVEVSGHNMVRQREWIAKYLLAFKHVKISKTFYESLYA